MSGHVSDQKPKEPVVSMSMRKALFRVTPVSAIVATIVIYFLSQLVAINMVALYGVWQGWSDGRIEHWFDVSLNAKLAFRIGTAAVGVLLIHGLLKLFKSSWKTIGLVKPKVSDFFSGLIGYGWYILLHLAVIAIVGVIGPQVDFDQAQQLGFSTTLFGSALLIVFISLVILPPIYEEILMRGLLFTGLRSKLRLPLTAVVVSVLFAIAHLEFGSGNPLLWAAAIDTFVLSLVLVYLRDRTGSLWPPIFLHAIKNFVAFTLLFVLKIP